MIRVRGDIKVNKIKSLFGLFFALMKIGLFTFGGGYAMIHLLDGEFVGKRRWLDSDEFMDLVAIAESTPGPIAINCATYIGYKREGVPGAIAATLGISLPSFVIIYLISLVFNQFLEISWVVSAFRGISVCVVFLIFAAGLKMLKKMKKTAFGIAVTSVTFALMLVLSLFSVSFSSIFYILIAGSLGALIYAIGYIKGRKEGGE